MGRIVIGFLLSAGVLLGPCAVHAAAADIRWTNRAGGAGQQGAK